MRKGHIMQITKWLKVKPRGEIIALRDREIFAGEWLVLEKIRIEKKLGGRCWIEAKLNGQALFRNVPIVEQKRDVIKEWWGQGYTQAEIAEKLDIGHATLKRYKAKYELLRDALS